MSIRIQHLAFAFTLPLLGAISASAENWSNWRGPSMNGSTSETGLPEKFSKEENVKWQVDLPGASGATPAVWGDHVFITSTDEAKQELYGMCYDRKTGAQKWSVALGKGYRADNRSNYASPSPATDGEHVAFFFGTGELAVLDFEGKTLWRTDLQEKYGKFYFLWTFSASPLIHDGMVIIQVLQRDTPVHDNQKGGERHESYLVAFDIANGNERWKVDRPSDAVSESREAFSTPVIHTNEGRTEILVGGGDCLTGHDPKTGQELWRWGTWNPDKIGHWRHVTSPVAGDGVVLACAPKGAPIYAIKLGGMGVLDDKAVAWVSEDKEVSADVSTPVYYEGRFYILNSDKQSISCVEPKTGKVIWNERLDTRVKFEASPTAGDGKLYLINFIGEVFVLKAGDKFEQLHRAELGEGKDQLNRASIALSQGNLFVRTDNKLYCIGK
jgi:outer membrane protein assembly factor BamB